LGIKGKDSRDPEIYFKEKGYVKSFTKIGVVDMKNENPPVGQASRLSY